MRLTFIEEVYFPAGLLRGLLAQHLPQFTWTCGEDDDGTAHCRFAMNRPVLLRGSRGGEGLFITVRASREPLADAPHRHNFVVSVDRPPAEPALVEPIMAMIALAFAETEPDCRCQPGEGQVWLDADQTRLVGGDVLSTGGRFNSGSSAAAPGVPQPAPQAAASPAGRSELARLPHDDKLPAERSALLGFDVIGMARTEESMADVLHNQMGSNALAQISGIAAPPAFARELPSRERLPTLVILFSAPPAIDWAKVQEGLDVIDPEGRWQVRASAAAAGTIHGRDCTISIDFSAAALPAYLPELALWRSFWVRSGEPLRRLRRHGAYVAIGCDLDCEAAEFVDIRQSAKAMCLALAVIAKFGPCVGVMNAAQTCIYTEDQLDMLVGPLGNDEVSIKLFLWTAFHSTKDDAVSLSTAGLLPFVGREVECWNAPGTLDFVGNKLNGVLRYLLINGPVIRNGDTIGEVEGDRSIRIYHGESDEKSGRPHSVPVLTMEFEGPGTASAPRPDPAVPALDDDPQVALLLEALRADASPQSRALLDELEDLIANPPPREVIESDANPIALLLKRWIALEQGEGKLPGGQEEPWQPPLDNVGALALIALTQGIGYPREQLEEMLGEAFPGYKWKAEDGPGGLGKPRAVLGQMPGRTIGVWIEARKEALPAAIAAPAHRVHVRVAVDAGRDAALARRVALVAASTLFLFQDKAAHVQINPGGNWLGHDDALTGAILPRHTTDIAGFDQTCGIPVAKLRGGNWMDGAAPPSTDRLEELYFAQAPAARVQAPVSQPAPGGIGFGRRAAGGGFGRKGL